MSDTSNPTPAPLGAPASPPDYRAPSEECDLVMKGGITSGVVYPPAILELAQKYRFRSIGGASAGAIAAAAAAAAEFGRESGGFERLEEVKEELFGEGFIQRLFQPSRDTKALYHAVLGVKKFVDEDRAPKDAARTLSASLRVWIERVDGLLHTASPVDHENGGARGALLAVALSVVLLWPLVALAVTGAGWLVWVARACLLVGVAIAVLACVLSRRAGRIVGGALGLRPALATLMKPGESYFGFCIGMPVAAPEGEASPALTDWLHRRINELAGLPAEGRPLTLGDLRVKKTAAGHDIGIQFKMVTTNLSQAQPYLLPKRSRELVFREDDMLKFFPAAVVERLKAEPPHGTVKLPDGFYIFPTEDNLPVVVATRLSLSFPVLLGAVRLYTIKGAAFMAADAFRDKNHEAGKPKPLYLLKLERDLEESWFSDGGIANNFPLSLFDAWIPTRPTFGINLCDAPMPSALRRAPDAAHDAEVFLPRPSQGREMASPPLPIAGYFDFFAALLETARTYRDSAQMRMASYRERVAQVYLDEGEGGLNLDMPTEVVEKVANKGAKAGQLFLTKFDFEEHLWVRTRLLFAHLERELHSVFQEHGAPGSKPLAVKYGELLEKQKALVSPHRWYRSENSAWCEEASKRMDALVMLIDQWEALDKAWRDAEKGRQPWTFFQENIPKPEGMLRVTSPT